MNTMMNLSQVFSNNNLGSFLVEQLFWVRLFFIVVNISVRTKIYQIGWLWNYRNACYFFSIFVWKFWNRIFSWQTSQSHGKKERLHLWDPKLSQIFLLIRLGGYSHYVILCSHQTYLSVGKKLYFILAYINW